MHASTWTGFGPDIPKHFAAGMHPLSQRAGCNGTYSRDASAVITSQKPQTTQGSMRASAALTVLKDVLVRSGPAGGIMQPEEALLLRDSIVHCRGAAGPNLWHAKLAGQV